MLKGAKREKKTVLEIADMYTKAFMEDASKLNIKWPELVSKATDNIDMYIEIITKLLDNGYAYRAGGNVYFDTSKLEDYYQLTNHKIDEMVVGVRDGVEEDNNKRNQADFYYMFHGSIGYWSGVKRNYKRKRKEKYIFSSSKWSDSFYHNLHRNYFGRKKRSL